MTCHSVKVSVPTRFDLSLMESGSDRSWVIGSIVGAFVVTTVCVGLFLRKEIARKVALGGSVFGLFIFPVGTLVSIVFARVLGEK